MNRIDLIIECLCSWKEVFPESWESSDELALTAALELKALHPVGTFAYDSENEIWEQLVPDEAGIELYALKESELPFKLSDAGADTNISRGLEPKGEGLVALHQPEQKPVARKTLIECIAGSISMHMTIGLYPKELLSAAEYIVDNYTTPPKREWVGLTDADLMKEFGYTDELLRDTAYRVQQKLKELNK